MFPSTQPRTTRFPHQLARKTSHRWGLKLKMSPATVTISGTSPRGPISGLQVVDAKEQTNVIVWNLPGKSVTTIFIKVHS